MRTKNELLKRILLLSLMGAQFPLNVMATDDGHTQHHTYHGHHHYNDYQSSYKEYIALESGILANPQATLDQIINFANASFSRRENGMSGFQLALEYSSKLPAGEVTNLELVSSSDKKLVLQLTVHESARTNPFVLLAALNELNNFYEISSLNANKVTEGFVKHPHYDHHIYQYHQVTYELSKSLGLSLSESHSHHSLNSTSVPFLNGTLLLEVMSNAKGGSILSQRFLNERKVKSNILLNSSMKSFKFLAALTDSEKLSKLTEYAALRKIPVDSQSSYSAALKSVQDYSDLTLKQTQDQLNKIAKIEYKRQVDEYKSGSQARKDLIAQKRSLSDMVKANDREAVARSMEIMLPWAIMEPSEKAFWSDYVDAIRSPDYKNAEILFRGTDSSEKIQYAFDKDGKTTGIGLFSKRLTSGSGEHFFKLLGLPETFETFGAIGYQGRVSALTSPHTLSSMMERHAGDPMGSPFISLTYSLRTAFNFSDGAELAVKDARSLEKQKEKHERSSKSGGIAAIRMDPRRLITNSTSVFSTELEVLASMLIFPDEVIYHEKGTNYGIKIGEGDKLTYEQQTKNLGDVYKNIRAAVYEKTKITLPESHVKYTRSGNRKFMDSLVNLKTYFDRAAVGGKNICSKLF